MNEGSHWYTREGKPQYQINGKNGKLRNINLRYDRKLGLVPSVTTVLQIVNKPQLNTWRENQMMLAAMTLQKLDGESDDSFCARVRVDAFKQVNEAAEEGSRVHDAAEQYYRGGMHTVPEGYVEHVKGIVRRVNELFPGVTDWIPEQSFAHPYGYGGRVDLHSYSTGAVVDFKGKDGDFKDGKKLAYDQHYQLSAYQRGLFLPQHPCANIFFSRTHPGEVTHRLWTVGELEEGFNFFMRALELWGCSKKYNPSFLGEASNE